MTYTEAINTIERMWIVLFEEMRTTTFEDLKNNGELVDFDIAYQMAIEVLKEKEEEEKIQKAVIKFINKKNTFGDILDDIYNDVYKGDE